MQKLVYVLSGDAAAPPAELRRRLLEDAGPRLLRAGIPGLSVSVADLGASTDASIPVRDTEGRMAALVNVWIDAPALRAEVARVLGAVAQGAVAGYAVRESIPLWYHDKSWPDGERTPGANLVTLLVANPALSHDGRTRSASIAGAETPRACSTTAGSSSTSSESSRAS